MYSIATNTIKTIIITGKHSSYLQERLLSR